MNDKPTSQTSRFVLSIISSLPTLVFVSLMLMGRKNVTPVAVAWAFCLSAGFSVGAAMMLFCRNERPSIRVSALIMFLNVLISIILGLSLGLSLSFIH